MFYGPNDGTCSMELVQQDQGSSVRVLVRAGILLDWITTGLEHYYYRIGLEHYYYRTGLLLLDWTTTPGLLDGVWNTFAQVTLLDFLVLVLRKSGVLRISQNKVQN